MSDESFRDATLSDLLNSRAARREPAPTGNGEVVIPFVLEMLVDLGNVAVHCGLIARAEFLRRVFNDLKARSEFGRTKYGTYLRTNNGRDTLNDLQQENYDSIMYSALLRMQGDVEASKWLDTYIEIAVHLQQVRESRNQ